MEISQIKAYKVALPFLMPIPHALTKGLHSENVVVEIIAGGEGLKGYGEGTPRKYVTGETQDEAVENIRHLIRHPAFPWKVRKVSDISSFIDILPDEKKINPALCALETALLDVLGRERGINMVNFFPHEFLASKIHYGGAFPLSNGKTLREYCLIMKKMDIRKIKMKVGKSLKKNQQALEIIRGVFADEGDLKIDVNGVWDKELALLHLPLLKEYRVKIVEQPLGPDDPDISLVAEAMDRNGIVLMADESTCSFKDMEKMVEAGNYKMVNIRLSKMGGLHKTLKIVDYLRKKGLPFQIACHLGESGLLSAAGRILGLLCRDALYYDGSYDALLLKQNITREPVSFGLRGEAFPLTGPGLGVEINEESLSQLTVGQVLTLTP
ncbi:MAG: enolase C-terminal domain-like protein [Thermodesulfobacteriota bacterium]